MSKKEKKLSFFDVVSNINSGPTAKDILEDATAYNEEAVAADSPEKAYIPFMINRSLSYFQDPPRPPSLLSDVTNVTS